MALPGLLQALQDPEHLCNFYDHMAPLCSVSHRLPTSPDGHGQTFKSLSRHEAMICPLLKVAHIVPQDSLGVGITAHCVKQLQYNESRSFRAAFFTSSATVSSRASRSGNACVTPSTLRLEGDTDLPARTISLPRLDDLLGERSHTPTDTRGREKELKEE
ncbi:hypothetical protein E2C01_015006 [Portunus trituberculatus]|uniref:Uncharacterized protein n=1 Tax=Portunus trituberculatus TaxID=210409 RepID=A0A5B7DK75_PORTR|nr:hypothetical protein [Portunus trituberculatus]